MGRSGHEFGLRALVLVILVQACMGGRRLTALVQQPPLVLNYHNGALLKGDLTISLVWYGKFSPSQHAIITDFLQSLVPTSKATALAPSVSSWWGTLHKYTPAAKAGDAKGVVQLGTQIMDEAYSMGRSLERAAIPKLAAKGSGTANIVLVFTAADVTVEGFCMSSCGFHGSDVSQVGKGKYAYIWVGNSETQCPGQCAWPFHQPIFGPQTPPLIAPNGDVAVDGMVINLASLLAGTATNPFGDGYYQGPASAPLEAASACPGIYGKGAYPGYAGDLLVDKVSGASYNANGVNGRKYVLPALWDPQTNSCSTLV
ncbi:protein EXORDIUM-like 1 [Amborella trichopoda]|uniref:Uncharacterized protein n=1 Tax=Amborella trichopoda TaxID=13333 RepID=U5D022_AMBTC|nr:protein EXORDIUM-like 1 [Amborella trichopoda]ERN14737.1 hypothetical protein AMTR_s00038p00235960 [Amborella trichopoda]|eukprot:XP_006853270.1 protein EXORDIUM-like 1 [Amborella trichopoda]